MSLNNTGENILEKTTTFNLADYMRPNQKAIVTGGTRGIGKAIVKELAKRSCCGVLFSDVVFIYNNCDECAEEIAKEINNPGTKIYGFKADATSMQDAQDTIDYAIEKLGGVDILINNAGITRDNLMLRMSEDDFQKVIDINLKGTFNYSKAVLKHMVGQRYGRIVNIASVVGVIGNAGQANYAASKAGVIGLTKSMAKELAGRNITVNAVAPGFIETDMTKKLNDKQREALLKNVPMKRMGTPEDVARVVAFLCSKDADYITGQVINVDGGMVM
jgi:3-oxoacyl-[acyl-carrier protein] reductase